MPRAAHSTPALAGPVGRVHANADTQFGRGDVEFSGGYGLDGRNREGGLKTLGRAGGGVRPHFWIPGRLFVIRITAI